MASWPVQPVPGETDPLCEVLKELPDDLDTHQLPLLE